MASRLDLAQASRETRELVRQTFDLADPNALIDRRPQYEELGNLLKRVHRDVRRNIQPPILLVDADTIEAFIRDSLDLLDHDIDLLSLHRDRVVTAQNVLAAGERLLATLSTYRALAEHYYNDTVQRNRKMRPAYEFDQDVNVMADRSNQLKNDTLAYLASLISLLE